jgi:hypothetical protein
MEEKVIVNTKIEFEKELESLVNKYSKENDSNTPDFILAQFILRSLYAFNCGVNDREKWYGREEKDAITSLTPPSKGE